MNVSSLNCKIQNYAWGSRSFIASLQGRKTPSDKPEAELWIGAHSGAPAEVVEGEGKQRLDELIAQNPKAALGEAVAQRYGGELPFLLKVLAAAQPLSLQAHPNSAQAEAGFAADEAAAIPLSAPERSYKDRRHKPELIVALTPFVALSGFRPVERTHRLFNELGVPALSQLAAPLVETTPERGLEQVFRHLMTAPAAEREALVNATVSAASRARTASRDFATEFTWVERLHALYPGDIGVVSALLLNLIELEPFEGLYLPAGNLHAYLDGAGVEIMAASDNVLRGGLTPKAVNVPELLRVLRFEVLEVVPLRPLNQTNGEQLYRTAASEFRLSYFQVRKPLRIEDRSGPELLLVTEGRVRVQGQSSALLLEAGGTAFVPASEGALSIEGNGLLFRARVAEPG
ncbi:MAG: mannose-6-phosphate isomerase, class I [Myxococcota bacterium]